MRASHTALACQKIENKRTRELSEEELTVLRDEVSKYQVEGDLVRALRVCVRLAVTAGLLTAYALQRRFNILAIKRLQDISCYRGRRHRAGLPVRGAKHERACLGSHLPDPRVAPLRCRPEHQEKRTHAQGQESYRGREEEGRQVDAVSWAPCAAALDELFCCIHCHFSNNSCLQ